MTTDDEAVEFLINRRHQRLNTLAVGMLDASNPMVCNVRMSLLGEYKAATAAHAKAVSELHKKIGVSSKPEYDVLKSRTEECRHGAAAAFEALERHMSEHGCDKNCLNEACR